MDQQSVYCSGTVQQSTCWLVNGGECRQTRPSVEITNLSKGAHALRLNTVIEVSEYERIKKQIHQLSITIAGSLEDQFPKASITEIGTDLAIDGKKGRVVLIEVISDPDTKG